VKLRESAENITRMYQLSFNLDEAATTVETVFDAKNLSQMIPFFG
jgi:hypothetical protein